jgi:hypothetical protein
MLSVSYRKGVGEEPVQIPEVLDRLRVPARIGRRSEGSLEAACQRQFRCLRRSRAVVSCRWVTGCGVPGSMFAFDAARLKVDFEDPEEFTG